jgi:hypothetical protein
MREPEAAFLRALQPGLFPMRDIALANGLMSYDQGQKKIEWFEGAIAPTKLNLATQISANNTTEFDFGTTYIGAVRPNMIIRFLDELVRVVSVDYTAGTCQVTRGFASTTPEATITVTVEGKIVSTTPIEGADAADPTAVFGDKLTNYVHYWEELVSANDVSQALSSRTPELKIAEQIATVYDKIGAMLANALWGSIAGGASATYPTMDGFKKQADSTSLSASVGAFLKADIDNGVVHCMDNGVIPDTLLVPGNVKVGLASWDRTRDQYGNQAPGRLGGEARYFTSASGPDLQILVDTSLPNIFASGGCEALICRAENLRAGFVPLLPNLDPAPGVPSMSGVRVERLARSGPSSKVEACTYATCQLHRPKGCWVMTGITSVDADGIA